jgi:tetratricopeptide (TPR) repeat protein
MIIPNEPVSPLPPTDSTTKGSAPGVPLRRRRFWLRVCLLILPLAALGLVGGWYYGKRHATPEPPTLDLTDADPAVAQAVNDAHQALLQAPRSEAAWGRYGMVLLANRFGPAALVCFAQAEQLNPLEPRWPYYQGLILLKDNPECKSAVPKLRRAVELSSNKTLGPRVMFVQLLLEEGLLEEAQTFLQGEDPTNPHIQIALARLALGQGDLGRAESLLGQAGMHPSVRKTAEQLLSELCQREGKGVEAAGFLKLAAALPADPPCEDSFMEEVQRFRVGLLADLDKAKALAGQNQLQPALQILRQAVKSHPESEAAWHDLGMFSVRQRDWLSAEQAFRTILLLDAENFKAHLLLGTSLTYQGKKTVAVEHFQKAIQANPLDPQGHFYLGQTLVDLEQRAAAKDAFREAIKVCPPFVEARRQLSSLLAAEGDTAGALEQLQKALEVEPANRACLKLKEELQAGQKPGRGPSP